jgi:membrane protein YqaA with SNARE-associated domain
MYDWVMKWASHKYNTAALGAISFMEASFFPIPPDPLLAAMGAAKPKSSLWYATVTTITSVLGGLFGYVIGYFFWQATQGFFLTYVFKPELFQKVTGMYEEHVFLSVFLASFTPIPFKIFTVAGGVAQVSLIPFILAALIGRGARFFMVGAVMYFFGPPVMKLVEKHFELMTIGFSVLLVGGFYVLKVLL